MLPVRICAAGRENLLAELDLPLQPTELLQARHPKAWEVELGFGKGRYLLGRARAESSCGFVGIEVASKYYRRVRDRARRDGLDNLILLRGEARYLLSAVMPAAFARWVHVYFPDPWPKSRHQERRLLDPESLDLLLRLLQTGGRLSFATDDRVYGDTVSRLVAGHPALRLEHVEAVAPRTHYEDKYLREGREIVRVEARLVTGKELFHPLAASSIAAATAPPAELPEGPGE